MTVNDFHIDRRSCARTVARANKFPAVNACPRPDDSNPVFELGKMRRSRLWRLLRPVFCDFDGGATGPENVTRVPSLRNVARTFPYGHAGRFFSLSSVFAHYRNGMTVMHNTDSLLQHKLALSNFEIGQLTAFLYTLTDSSFLTNPRFAPPGSENIGKAPMDIHP